MAGKRKKIDWESVERDYVLGQKSLRVIAAQYNTTAGSISKKAKKMGWVQDKTQEVRERTRAALIAEGNTKGNTRGNTPTREDVANAVQTNIEVIRGHRAGILKARELVGYLMSQLQDAAECRMDLRKAIAKSDESPQAKSAMSKAVALPAHAGVVRDLSTALKNLITLERQAFNLDEPGAVLEDVLAALPGPFRDRVREALAKSVS